MGISIDQFITLANKMRLAKPQQWQSLSMEVNGVEVRIKFYDHWTQVMRAGGVYESGNMQLTITGWKDELRKFLAFTAC